MRIPIACALILVVAPALLADSVVLVDGRKMTGEVIADDANGVQLKVKGGVVTFKREEVKEVVTGGADGEAGALLDPVGARFGRTENADVDALREQARERLRALEKAAALARKDKNDADGLRDQVEASEKRIDSMNAERERMVARFDKSRAAYDTAAAKCGSGG